MKQVIICLLLDVSMTDIFADSSNYFLYASSWGIQVSKVGWVKGIKSVGIKTILIAESQFNIAYNNDNQSLILLSFL